MTNYTEIYTISWDLFIHLFSLSVKDIASLSDFKYNTNVKETKVKHFKLLAT